MTEHDNEFLKNIAKDLMELVDELPADQYQATRRNILRGQLAIAVGDGDAFLVSEINNLRAHCNREINRMNQEGPDKPIAFHRMNELLISCDKVFRALTLREKK